MLRSGNSTTITYDLEMPAGLKNIVPHPFPSTASEIEIRQLF